MKKIYNLLLLLAITATGFSQTVIIDQPNNAAGNALVDFEGNNGVGVYTSDDFSLTSETVLGEIDIFGRLSNVTNFNNLLSFNLIIYADNAGLPAGDPSQVGTGIIELRNISSTDFTLTEDGAGSANFTVRVTDANGGNQIVLPAGTYWLAAFPIVDEAFATGGTNRWNWNESTAPNVGTEPVLIDPSDAFGGGITMWTNIATLIGAPFPSNAFQIRDEPPLSVDEFSLKNVTVTPNPTQDFINIEMPNGINDFATELYDMTGKLILKSNNEQTINLTSLQMGMYLLKISTTDSVVSTRIIRN